MSNVHEQETLHIREQVELAPLTTIQIGGPARFFAAARSRPHLVALIDWARRHDHNFFILGGGSNLLFDDNGYDGLVIHMQLKGVTQQTTDRGKVRLRAAAGENWDAFVAHCVTQNLAGLTCLSGIPGCVGAAPIQNIGAYGQEVAQTLHQVEILDLDRNQTRILDNRECAFAYRDSIFKRALRNRAVVTAVSFDLTPNGRPTLAYPDLVKRLGADATLTQVRETVLAVRREKSMVADPADPNARSCGSFFTNPIISATAYAAFKTRCPQTHPAWPQDADRVKLSAAWLIERAGFHKGWVAGRAGLSEKHCLALINRNQAKASDVIALKKDIQRGVFETFGIELEPEPLLLSQGLN